MIESLALEDCEQAGRDHEPRRSAGADLPSVDRSTECGLLGPARAPPESEHVLPLALALTRHWLGRLLKNLSGNGCGRGLLDRELAPVEERKCFVTAWSWGQWT